MLEKNETTQHLASVALDLFMAQGIKKTSMQEIADHAGLSRMTLYRYFVDRKQATKAAFDLVLEDLRSAIDHLPEPMQISTLVNSLVHSLAELPRGDFPGRLEEFFRLYPEEFNLFEQQRKQLIKTLTQRVVEDAEAKGLLRPGLNRQVINAYFETAVVNILMNPGLISENLPPDEVFETVTNIFLFGILKKEENNEKDIPN